MKLQYTLTSADFVANAAFETRSMRMRLPLAWVNVLLWAAFFAALVLLAGDSLSIIFIAALSAFVALQIVARLQRHLWSRRYYSADRLRGLAGQQQIEVTEHFLRETAPNRDVTWRWEDYSAIYETPTHLFIKPTPINTVIVPRSAFSSDSERSQFIALVKDCVDRKAPTSQVGQ